MENTVTLGSTTFPVVVLPFKQLRRLLPVINRVAPKVASGVISDDVMADLADIIATGTGQTVEELDSLAGVKFFQMTTAFVAIVEAAGLKEQGSDAGKPTQATDGTGTSSTPTSSPVPAGPGTT